MQEEERTSGYGEPSKAYRIVRGCFKGLLYGASALVWILIFFTLFSTRESKLLERMYFTDATRSFAETTEDYRVRQLYPAVFMNRDGSIELRSIYYAAETGELEIGVKYNKKLTDGNTEDGILYALTDQDGTAYAVARLETDVIGRYGYARVCFTGLSLPLEEVGAYCLTLSLYKQGTDEPLSTYLSEDRLHRVNNAVFTIYDNSTHTATAAFDD